MSPVLFEYNGIEIKIIRKLFRPTLHAFYKNCAMKITFYISQGNITGVEYDKVKGRKEFNETNKNDLKRLVNSFKILMLLAWQDFVIYNYDMTVKKITDADLL